MDEVTKAKKCKTGAMFVAGCNVAIDFPKKLSGLTVVDIGAGMSPCVSWLLEQGANAYAVDPLYASKENLEHKMRENIQIQKATLRDSEAKKAYAIDEMKNAARLCRRSMERNSSHYIAAYAGFLPFRNDFADFVYSIDCIAYCMDEDPVIFKRAIDEALRILKPGCELQLYGLSNIKVIPIIANYISVVTHYNSQWPESSKIERIGPTKSRMTILKPASR